MSEVETYLDEDGITKTRPKYPELSIEDSEYDAVEIPSFEAGKNFGEDLVKVIVEVKDKDIQKTGVVCPNCWRPADFVK